MSSKKEFEPETLRLLKDGEALVVSIEKFLGSFHDFNTFQKLSEDQKQTLQQIAEQTIFWFNEIKLKVLPRTLYGEAFPSRLAGKQAVKPIANTGDFSF